MTCHSALELLLPELQRQILLQLDSFQSLSAFIHASPRIYQVFRLNKKVTLSELARRQFDLTTIRAFQGIERLCQVEEPPFSRDTVLQFFSSTFDELHQFRDSDLPLSVSVQLGKLDNTIRFFANEYAEETLPIVTQLSSQHVRSQCVNVRNEHKNDCDAPKIRLSQSESDRLRRAFCGFGLYRQLFSQCRCSSSTNQDTQPCGNKVSFAPWEQAELFVQHMPAYQATEVACICDYLHRLIWDVCSQVEDEVVQELQAGYPNPKDKYQGLRWDLLHNAGRHQYLARDDHIFGYYGLFNQTYHIEYLSSLGLSYIRKLVEAVGDERRNLLLRPEINCNTQNRNTRSGCSSIRAALGLDALPEDDHIYGWYIRDLDSCLDNETKRDLPLGWLWAHRDNNYYGVVDPCAKGLRGWGYVFWDWERLQAAGVLDLDPHEVRMINFDDCRAYLTPSVQERWLGPRKAFTHFNEGNREAEEGQRAEMSDSLPELDLLHESDLIHER